MNKLETHELRIFGETKKLISLLPDKFQPEAKNILENSLDSENRKRWTRQISAAKQPELAENTIIRGLMGNIIEKLNCTKEEKNTCREVYSHKFLTPETEDYSEEPSVYEIN